MPIQTQSPLPNGAQFHEDLAAGWSRGYADGTFKRRLEFIDKFLRVLVEPGSRWLDAGCGSGALTRHLAELGANGDAVDASPAMIRAASEQAVQSEHSTSFAYRCITTLERTDCADNYYDGVLCSSVIEYLDDPDAAFRELTRTLKPGGKLVVSLANRHSIVRKIQQCVRAAGFRSKFAYLDVSRTTFTRNQMIATLQACGIRIDDVRGFDPVLPAWLARRVPPALIFVSGTKTYSDR